MPIHIIHPEDNVGVTTVELAKGETANGIAAREKIPRLHKIALTGIAAGRAVVKYGEAIGTAAVDIPAGAWVHCHNVAPLSDIEAEFRYSPPSLPAVLPLLDQSFSGYLRPDGRAATRNVIAVISPVNCSATVAQQAARVAQRLLRRYPQLDAIVPVTHAYGCGLTTGALPDVVFRRAIRSLARHPNIAGCVLIGLGCEGCYARCFAEEGLPLIDLTNAAAAVPDRIDRPIAINVQSEGGTRAAIAKTLQIVERMARQMGEYKRQTLPVSKLTIALNCGGTSPASGITANPALGCAVDLLVRAGATAVGAETPEIVPRILAKRAVSQDVAHKLIEIGDWWRSRYLPMFGALYRPPPTLEINPSPGNRDSGLTTVTEKALGAHAKFGTTGLCGVFDYAEVVRGPGFVFMDTPGTDQVSWTGLMAGGAQVGVFTTGLGSCLGSGIMPTIKVAATTELYTRMQGDMDLSAGRILDGTASIEQVGREIYDLILDVAAGRSTRSERLGYGWHEFAPWFFGPQG